MKALERLTVEGPIKIGLEMIVDGKQKPGGAKFTIVEDGEEHVGDDNFYELSGSVNELLYEAKIRVHRHDPENTMSGKAIISSESSVGTEKHWLNQFAMWPGDDRGLANTQSVRLTLYHEENPTIFNKIKSLLTF